MSSEVAWTLHLLAMDSGAGWKFLLMRRRRQWPDRQFERALLSAHFLFYLNRECPGRSSQFASPLPRGSEVEGPSCPINAL